jgi:DNA-binding MarR family transcriptional regulator
MMLRQSSQRTMTMLPAYLREALGVELRLRSCADTLVPAYLTHTFAFACGEILDVECVFAVPLAEEGQAPSALEKHVARIAKAFGSPALLVAASLSSRDRQRLIKRHVPFIVPFTQLYLPPLGIDFRERVRPRSRGTEVHQAPGAFTPVTQLVLLRALLRATPGELHARELADALAVSTMSISRAFRDLEAANLVTRWREGRRRPIRLAGAKGEVWREAQPLLQSPVKTRYVTDVREIPGALEAGETALARISNLAPPREPVVAISAEAWRGLELDSLRVEASTGAGDAGQMLVEVWTYPPQALSVGPGVDVLSLYCSLRDEHDERIEIALEDAMESLPW